MMKYLIFLSLISTSFNLVFAQTNSSTTTEQNLNQQLMDNATASQKALENANPGAPPTSIHILSNGGSSTSTTSSANLTDQEKQLSENYVDQAAANKILTEKCAGDEMTQACNGTAVKHKVLGMDTGLIKSLTQAYATFGSMGDFMSLSKPAGKTKTTDTKNSSTDPKADGAKTDGAKTDGTKTADDGSSKKKEKANDNCKYIPSATETIAAMSQKGLTESLNNGEQTSQKEALEKAAKSHDGRAEQAKIQSAGWYLGAACYAYMGISGSAAIDTSYIVKLGAATLLGTFYVSEVMANQEYARKTREIKDALPGKGQCNPVTENNCYCAEPEHANDPNYCKAQIAASAANTTTFTRVACTNNQLQADPHCSCDKTNTCFEKFLENQDTSFLNLGFGNGSTPFKAIASLAHGRLETGTLGGTSYAASAAIANKMLSEYSSKVPSVNLNADQKVVADAIASRGIPASVARLMAANPPSAAAMAQASSKLKGLGALDFQVASNGPGRSNVVDFSGGNGLGIRGTKSDKKGGGADDFLGKVNAKNGTSNAKILEFAQKAQSQASQITKSDRALFEIISLRYQTSGRKLLQVDPNN